MDRRIRSDDVMSFRRASRFTTADKLHGIQTISEQRSVMLYTVEHCILVVNGVVNIFLLSLAEKFRHYVPLKGRPFRKHILNKHREPRMRKEASLPVRLDTDLSRRLDMAAERLGLTKSALIRVLVKSFVDELEAKGGKITFPLRWQKQK